MRRATPALLIAIAAAFALASCGGDDEPATPTKAEYKQTYTALSKELAIVGAAVGEAVAKSAGKSNKQLEKTFNTVAEQTRDIAGKFENATPPADPTVRTQQAKLVAGLNLAADDLEAISKAAGKKDLKAAGEAAAKLTRDNTAVSTPRVALEKALGIPQPKPPVTTTTRKK